jgi:hypothetical protein
VVTAEKVVTTFVFPENLHAMCTQFG